MPSVSCPKCGAEVPLPDRPVGKTCCLRCKAVFPIRAAAPSAAVIPAAVAPSNPLVRPGHNAEQLGGHSGQPESPRERVARPAAKCNNPPPLPDQIVYNTSLHPVVYLYPVTVLLSALPAWLAWRYVAGDQGAFLWLVFPILAISGALFVGTYFNVRTSLFTITARKIAAKTGFLTRRVFELQLGQVEGVEVEQPLPGRVLDYGTVIVTGTGSSKYRFENIRRPFEFRDRLQKQIATRP